MLPREFDCPVCRRGKVKQFKTDHGEPKIKLPIDLGNGTDAMTEVALLWCDRCNNVQMFMNLDKVGKIPEIGKE